MFLSCYSVCSFVRFPVDIIPLVASANKLSQTALNFFADSQHRRAACILPLSLSAGADFQGTNFLAIFFVCILLFFFIYGIIIVVSVIEHMFTSSSFLITLTNHSTLVIVVCTSQKGQYISLYWTCMNSQQCIIKIAVTSDSHPMYTYRS